eukprot:TRINITY_DN68366_c0_g1_i1.p1 TRINITY_DN68366_c0_g1~~TRINITY_DN68366_c0_g1_i1.p1  ORF type:complete len:418 (-),score=31.05 TRINITY_DN68366_c0_g1_i1:64-1203(-)
MEEVEVHPVVGRAIRGVRLGPRGSGDQWLLMHGWLDNCGALVPLLSELYACLGSDVELVAIDLAGHGLSDHRQDGYLMVDYAADALLIADVFGWERFSLLGHSLGGAIASLAAGAMPERIERLVMVDIIGPSIMPVEDAPLHLAKHVRWTAERTTGAKSGGSRLRVFPSVSDAAKHRSENTIGGVLSFENAMLITQRGVVPTNPSSVSAAKVGEQGLESGACKWASDPRLLRPSPLYLSSEMAEAFMRAIKCPTLVLATRDGIYSKFLKAGRRVHGPVDGGIPFTHAFGRPFGVFLRLVWLCCKIIERALAFLPFPTQRKAVQSFAAHVWHGPLVSARLRSVRHLRYEELTTGGHHVHMTRPVDVAKAVAGWTRCLKRL